MFFYLYCGRGFNCLYGGWTKILKTFSVNTKGCEM